MSFQSAALPTELPGHIEPHDKTVKKRNYSKNADFYRVLRPFSQWSGALDWVGILQSNRTADRSSVALIKRLVKGPWIFWISASAAHQCLGFDNLSIF